TPVTMKSFEARTRIAASPETIWAVLTDAPGFPEWEPNVERIEGTIAPGEKITVHTSFSPDRAFPVKVAVFEPPRRMVWRGGMPFGLFVGERTFTLTPQPDGTTEVHTREEFRGLLSPLIGRSIPDLTPTFEQFAAALKTRAEAS
ncbi:MAG: SRPBCC domain-containing protein, partial [Bacteroidota bacterium]